jgi:hypothetical protein
METSIDMSAPMFQLADKQMWMDNDSGPGDA